MPTIPRPPKKAKAPVVRLTPVINKPLGAEAAQVVRKLKKALETAQAGLTIGAIIIELNTDDTWTADLAGRLSYDPDTVNMIVCRMMHACLTEK